MLYAKKEKKAPRQLIVTKDDDYYTPKYVVDYFYPNGFDYDPATCEDKAKEFGVPFYDTIETDGLAQDWTKYDRIWINPPFTKKYDFLKKAVETYNIARNTIYVLFPVEFLTTAKFHELNCHCALFIPKGRINFESGLGKTGKSPAFGSVVIKLADKDTVEYIDLKTEKNIVAHMDKYYVPEEITKKSWYM